METYSHPIFTIAMASFAAAVACLVFACITKGWAKRGILAFVALILLAPSALALVIVKPELVDGRYRTYKQLYRDIQAGMSRAEVMALVEKHYPEAGQRLRPTVVEDSEERLSFNMDPEGAREPNCEGISVNLQQDKVVYKFYSRD